MRPESGGSRLRGRTKGSHKGHYPEPLPAGFVLFLVYVAFAYLQAGIRFPILGAIRAEFILGLLLAILSAAALAAQGREFAWTSAGKWGVALLILLGLMSIASVDVAHSWTIYVDRVFKFSLLTLFSAALVTSPLRLKLFVLVFLLACAKMGQEGLLGTITGSMMWENQGIPRLHGSTPNYLHPNSFSGMAVGALPFVVFTYPLVSRNWRIALAVLGVLMLNIILRTGSRTGYVAFFIGLMWLTTYSKRPIKVIAAVVAALFVAVPFIPDEYIGRAASIFETVEAGADTSTGQRKEILIDAWDVFKRRPLGVGVAAFPIVREQWFGRTQDTHNLYLEVATNAGIQGVIIFLGFVISIFTILRRVRSGAEVDLKALGWARGGKQADEQDNEIGNHIADLLWIRAMAASFIGFLVIRLSLGLFGMDLYERYWWFAAGGAIALFNIQKLAAKRTTNLRARLQS